MEKIIYIFIGGGIGATLRYWISGLPYRFFDGSFPWGTLTVNLIGCYIIGFLWSLSESYIISSNARNLIFIGIIGAFTTFSTYGLETLNLFRSGEIKYGLINIFASNIFGIALVFLGFISSRFITGIFK